MIEIYEQSFKIPVVQSHKDLLSYFKKFIANHLAEGQIPIRFVITGMDSEHYFCELGIIKTEEARFINSAPSIFSFEKRKFQSIDQFNVVLMVPTGIGAEIGGHAGDACPVAKMLASISDHLITHPNVVNASDINEMPENGVYVEGSTLCRLMMGSIALEKVRSNDILFVVDKHSEPSITNDYQNCANAVRATHGLTCRNMIELDPPTQMTIEYTGSGRASGRVAQLGTLLDVLDSNQGDFHALALATHIEFPPAENSKYFKSDGQMINPWGGVEAIFTHAISLLYDLPCAHAPMITAEDLHNSYFSGRHVVDPRMSAEFLSITLSYCIFKGLQKSPRIVSDPLAMQNSSLLRVEDIACLVIPEGCLGLPVLAALEQGITVIAVKENSNLMRNDLSKLPWRPDQYFLVENYWEAAGVLSALKAGIAPGSVRRPLLRVPFSSQKVGKATTCV